MIEDKVSCPDDNGGCLKNPSIAFRYDRFVTSIAVCIEEGHDTTPRMHDGLCITKYG